LVLGGSQGAQALNEHVPKALSLLEGRVQIRHQTGVAMQAQTQALYQSLGLQAETPAFIEDMAEAYLWADLAICRSGAMTLGELAASGLPAILIPYPFAIDDHQTANARCLAQAGAALLLPQTELTPEHLANTLKPLLANPATLQTLSQAARALAKPDAARVVADICLAEARA
jgi:UDP-N-acetylglucosamine--N-acetylmuramyl-(pentapeptide) pyrophosphoryl-undecaprenol N-acetylglucosamine transferase